MKQGHGGTRALSFQLSCLPRSSAASVLPELLGPRRLHGEQHVPVQAPVRRGRDHMHRWAPTPAHSEKAASSLLHRHVNTVTAHYEMLPVQPKNFHCAAGETKDIESSAFSKSEGWLLQTLPSRTMGNKCTSVKFWRQQGFKLGLPLQPAILRNAILKAKNMKSVSCFYLTSQKECPFLSGEFCKSQGVSASLGFSEWRAAVMLHKIQVILSGDLFCFGFLGVWFGFVLSETRLKFWFAQVFL